MRCGNHDPTGVAQPLRKQSNCGSRNNAGILNYCRSARESSSEVLKNPRARHTCVLPNQYFAAEFLSDRAADCEDCLRIKWKLACTGANAIRTKQLCTHVNECNREANYRLRRISTFTLTGEGCWIRICGSGTSRSKFCSNVVCLRSNRMGTVAIVESVLTRLSGPSTSILLGRSNTGPIS